MSALVVGLGGHHRGDDGVGLAVAEQVRATAPWLDVVLVRDAADLIDLLGSGRPVILVDAVRTDRHEPGTLLPLSPKELQTQAQRFQQQVEGWAATASAFDSALKELGDFENYVNVLEWDMKKVADSLERHAASHGGPPPVSDGAQS